ncbi:hypothetical protein [Nocardia sp. NPDC052566]|uniref:hypothetical protein n=1 Tax=Nocardia sp. NPDC052566 TaxID=3364330 RepID=UPI0037CB25FC
MPDGANRIVDPELSETLARYALEAPRDGDCLHTVAKVTNALIEKGFQAHAIPVAGWIDLSSTMLGFLHHVTICGDVILDGTARQFNTTLPTVWIAPTQQYLRDLADKTGVHHASFFPPG